MTQTHVTAKRTTLWAGGRLHVIDVANPAAPSVCAVYRPPDGCWSPVDAAGGRVYCRGQRGSTNYRLNVVDVSDPTSPTFLGSYGPLVDAGLIQVEGTLAYVKDYRHLRILDVSNPQSPVLLSAYDAGGGGILDFEVSGDTAYVTTADRFLVVDVANPAAPALQLTWTQPGVLFVRLGISAGLAYVSGNEWGGFHVVDLSDPTSPVLRGTGDFPTSPTYAWDLCAAGDKGYLAWEQGLMILDAGDPDAPAVSGSYLEPGNWWGIEIADALAYGPATSQKTRQRTFEVIDVGNPRFPRPVGRTSLPLLPQFPPRIAASGDFAYVALGFKLAMIDISDPASPTVQAIYDEHSVTEHTVQVVGERVYYTNGSRLRMMDVSDPSSPTFHALGDAVVVGFSGGFSVSGTTAYTTSGSLRIYDVADPSSPVLLGEHGGYRSPITVVGNRAYIDALEILDVGNPLSPTLLGTFDSRTGNRADVSDNFAFLYGRYSNPAPSPAFEIVDVSDPTSPALRATFTAFSSPGEGNPVPIGEGARMTGDLIYLAMGPQGFWILRYTGPRPPWTSARVRWIWYE